MWSCIYGAARKFKDTSIQIVRKKSESDPTMFIWISRSSLNTALLAVDALNLRCRMDDISDPKFRVMSALYISDKTSFLLGCLPMMQPRLPKLKIPLVCPILIGLRLILRRGLAWWWDMMSSRYGSYLRKCDARRIRRFFCRDCGKHFSEATSTFEYRQRRRDINFDIFKQLASNTSLRRTAFLVGAAEKQLIADDLLWPSRILLSEWAAQNHTPSLGESSLMIWSRLFTQN